MIEKKGPIYVAGHTGMVGSALVRRLVQEGHDDIVTQSSDELDLRRQQDVESFFNEVRPETVFVAAAKVGGIHANNTYRAEFIYDNLAIELNLINSAWRAGVNNLVFLSSSCIYPRLAKQPMSEEMLWTGALEPTNEPYAVAKLAGMSLCQAYNDQYGTRYLSVVPTNLYGKNDDYGPENSHVVAALIAKFHRGKVEQQPFVPIWGTGTPRREFMHVDDAVDAIFFLLNRYEQTAPINIGCGHDVDISTLASIISNVVAYEGEIQYDTSKQDGAPRKLLDSGRLTRLGWKPSIALEEGLVLAYQDFLEKMC